MQLLTITILVVLIAAPDNGNRAREANRAYEQGDYQRAGQLYREILEEQPGNRYILFNLGSALARQGQTEASMETFRRYRDLADEPTDRAPAEYNLGFLHGESGNTEEAIEHFRQSLELNPDDEDAKFNYELLRRRQQRESQDDDPQDNDQQEREQQQQPQDARPPPASGDDGQSDDDEPGEPYSAPSTDPSQPEQERQAGQPEISGEQLRHAEDIMNALEQIEKDLIKDFRKRQLDPVEPHEKDW